MAEKRACKSGENDHCEQEHETECHAGEREGASRVHSAGEHGFPCCKLSGQLHQRTQDPSVSKGAWALPRPSFYGFRVGSFRLPSALRDRRDVRTQRQLPLFSAFHMTSWI